MARAATTTDVFNAIAEPKRRLMLDALSRGEQSVNEIMETLRWPQPQVSKHLGVLRQVGLVEVRREGAKRMYRVNGDELKPVHEWVKQYERFWEHHLDRIKAAAEAKAKARKAARTTERN